MAIHHQLSINRIFFSSYNCEDPNCYLDLTRLRGLKYVTWEDKTKLVQQDEVTH